MNEKAFALGCAFLVAVLSRGGPVATPTGSIVQWGDGVLPSIAPHTRFTAIAAGDEAAFAISSERTLFGWRWNGYREIPSLSQSSNVVAVSASTHTLALRPDGTVLAWGDNRDGGTNVPPGLSNVVAVSAMYGHSLALKSDGTVVAWGDNFCGESDVPPGLSNIVAVSAGSCTSFLLRADGTVLYLGNHTNLVIGGLSNVVAIAPDPNAGAAAWMVRSDGSVVYSYQVDIWLNYTNTVVAGLSNIVAVANTPAGDLLALQSEGTVVYFLGGIQPCLTNAIAIAGGGAGLFALTADGRAVQFGVGLSAQAPTWAFTRDVTRISGGSLALRSNGDVVFWGAEATGGEVSNAVAVAQGYEHSLALKTNGTVAAWGNDSDGQCDVPAGLSNVMAIAAGGYHSLALKTDGTIAGWGYNAYGQASGPGPYAVVAISAGALHSLALLNNGTVRAWGYNAQGQLNVSLGLTNVIAISAGGAHNLALKSDGTVVAWGYNNYGQCNIPPGLSNVIAVAAGGDHSLALKADGTIVGWGSNDYGESTVPNDLGPVIAISAGFNDTMAIVLPPVPLLTINSQPFALNQVALSWPSVYSGFTLQSSPTLVAASWSDWPNAPVNAGGQYWITNSISVGAQFFRLRK